jgi:hypothetical protein
MMNHRMIQALLVTSLIVAPSTVSAQVRMTLGGGVAMSRLTGDNAGFEGIRQRRGIFVNFAADIPLLGGGILSVVPGGVYIDRGFTFVEEAFDESALKLSYLQVVAPLRLDVPIAGPVGVHAFGGPGFGVSFGCQFTRRRTGSITSFDCTNDEFQFKSIDVTAMGGGGLTYRLPNDTRIMLTAALNTSLSSVDSSESNLDIRHRSLLFGAGVTYPLQTR